MGGENLLGYDLGGQKKLAPTGLSIQNRHFLRPTQPITLEKSRDFLDSTVWHGGSHT